MTSTDDVSQQIAGGNCCFRVLTTVVNHTVSVLCKITITKCKSLNLGMEALMNAPLHTFEPWDKVNMRPFSCAADAKYITVFVF